MEKPETIHDFGGFPQSLFNVQYPVKGNPKAAREIKSLVQTTEIGLDHEWGLDHGCWSVIKQMYPNADIPVLQLSIDYSKPGSFHFALAEQLKSLRNKGVLIVGSGNIVHNLRMMAVPQGSSKGLNTEFAHDWAIELNEKVKAHIISGNYKELIDYQSMGKAATLAIPTPDHYFPLLYSLALKDSKDAVAFFNDKYVAGSISMTSLQIG